MKNILIITMIVIMMGCSPVGRKQRRQPSYTDNINIISAAQDDVYNLKKIVIDVPEVQATCLVIKTLMGVQLYCQPYKQKEKMK